MKVEVFTKNDIPTYSFPDTVVRDVDISVTRTDVEGQQEANTFHLAKSVCRIKILDEETGKYAWFVVTPMIKNNRPGVEVEAIGTVNETVRKHLLHKWKGPR